MSQSEISSKLNISTSSISKIESGKKTVDLEMFIKWVEITNTKEIAITMLFGEEGIKNLHKIKSKIVTEK